MPREEVAFTNLYTASCHTSTHILSCKNNESFRRRSCRYDDNQREWPLPYFQKWFWDHTHRHLREIFNTLLSYVDIPLQGVIEIKNLANHYGGNASRVTTL